MNDIIDCTRKGLIVYTYEEDIKKLLEMKKIYRTNNNLNGAIYRDMIEILDSQIAYCEVCIKNAQ